MFLHRTQIGKLQFFITDRRGGVSRDSYSTLNLGFYSGDEPDNVMENRRLLCESLGIEPSHLFVPKEVHGTDLKWITEDALNTADASQSSDFECDALVTTLPGVCVGVTTADCVPVLVYDDDESVVAAVHAGWKGVVRGILPKTIEAIQSKMGIKPSYLNVKIYPCISLEHFEVGEEVVQAFEECFSDEECAKIIDRDHYVKAHIDLRQAVKCQALSAGLSADKIEVSEICTYQNEDCFSARRDGFASGRMVTGIMITK